MDTQLMTVPVPELANRLEPTQVLSLEKFTPPQTTKISQITASIGRLDSSAVDNFGTEPQQRANQFLDQLLQGYKTYEAGPAGAITLDLARQIKGMNLPKLKDEATGNGNVLSTTLQKIPFVGKYASAIYQFKLAHDDILKFLGEIEDRAQREFGKLAATNAKLDQLADNTLENIRDLELYIAAGQQMLLQARADFTSKRDSILQNSDSIALTKLRDEAEQINAFETRLLKMQIAFTEALVSIPEIRMTQESARIEARNIKDTLLFDLPKLKRAILRVSALMQIGNASKETEARHAMTRDLDALSGSALNETYIRAKESQGSGAEDIAVLAQTADKILETIAAGVRIDEQNREKRQTAQKQLEQVQTRLMDGLRTNAVEMVSRSV